MPEISLDELTKGREGVILETVELRRRAARLTDDRIREVGLAEAIESERIYAFPADPTNAVEGATMCSVALLQFEDFDSWNVVWSRMRGPLSDVPDDIQKASVELGGVAGLEQKLGQLWKEAPPPIAPLLVLSYGIPDTFEIPSRLLRDTPIKAGDWSLRNVGTIWEVPDSDTLSGVSFVRSGKQSNLNIVQRLPDGGWPDLTAIEAQAWQDLLQVLAKTR